MTSVRSSLLARGVFVLLALATVAAFFITQRLKTSDPVVDRLAIPLVISPNGDGRKDTAEFSRAFDTALCLDISHTMLACNFLNIPLSEAV